MGSEREREQERGDTHHIQVLVFEEIDRLEEIRVVEPESGAGLEVCLDVLHLLIGDILRVDPRNGPGLDTVDEGAQNYAGFEGDGKGYSLGKLGLGDLLNPHPGLALKNRVKLEQLHGLNIIL